MARFMKSVARFRGTFLGKLLTVMIYAAMLALILIFFSGHGAFIYENF
jgi:hypothetical protein